MKHMKCVYHTEKRLVKVPLMKGKRSKIVQHLLTSSTIGIEGEDTAQLLLQKLEDNF